MCSTRDVRFWRDKGGISQLGTREVSLSLANGEAMTQSIAGHLSDALYFTKHLLCIAGVVDKSQVPTDNTQSVVWIHLFIAH